MALPHDSIDSAFVSYQQTGRTEYLAEVFDAASGHLLQLAHHISPDLNVAEDLVQATFLAAIEHRDRFDGKGHVVSWLFGIMTNQARMRRRTANKHLANQETNLNSLIDLKQQNPAEAFEGKELSKAVINAITKMADPYPSVLNWYLRYGFTAAEIAVNLNRSPNTVRTQLARGLEMLRKALPTSLIAGSVVLTTPVQGLSAMREVVLQKASAVATKSATTNFSLFGLNGKVVPLGGAGTLAVAALAVTLFVAREDEQRMETEFFSEAPVAVLSAHDRVLEEESQEVHSSLKVDPLSSRILLALSSTDGAFFSPRHGSVPPSKGVKLVMKPTILLPILALGASALFPNLLQSQSQIYGLGGENSIDQLGWSVSGAGDVNQDGYADFVVGSGKTVNSLMYVYSGKNGTTLWIFAEENFNDFLGEAVSGAGDVNQDGYDDVMGGARFWDDPNDPNGGSSHGRVYVYSGKDGTVLWAFNGENGSDYLGGSVSDASDVNQDGYDDVVAAAMSWDDPNDPNAGTSHGRVYVFSGQDGTTLFTFDGENSRDGLGRSVSGAGDVNQDGYADLLVGSSGWDDPNGGGAVGRVYVYSGQDGTTLWTFDGENQRDLLGFGVSSAFDVDQDGYVDVLAAAVGWDDPNDPNAGQDHGRVYVYSGQDGTTLWTFNGENAGDSLGGPEFGYGTVSGPGDVNQDGYADIAAGAPLWDKDVPAGILENGRMYVYSGKDGTTLFTVDGENGGSYTSSSYVYGDGDNFGWSVSGAGDVNGDGVPDLVAGAPLWDDPTDPNAGTSHGRVYVISGAKLSLSADEHLISVATGGVSNLNLCVPAHANKQYLILGSLSLGSTIIGSGVPTSGATMPIVNDIWTTITWVFRNGPVFINTQASLDGSGLATATINWPPALVVLGGNVTTYYAALIYGANDCGAGCDLYYATTNPVPVTFTP